jgi:predicted deacylase
LVPIEVVRSVVNSIDPHQLRGRVIAIPVANPLAFETFTRHTPTDMHNLNRVFPGTQDSWISELLARSLVDYLVPGLDALLDLHSGGAIPTVDYVYALNDLELSRAFLFPTMYRGSSYPGSLGTHVVETTGASVVVAEIGGGNQFDRDYLARGTAGVCNALKKLGCLPGLPDAAPEQILLTKMAITRPRQGGILIPEVTADRLGTEVPKGTLLGTIRDAQTFEVLEEIHAPFERTHLVLVRSVISKVHPGDYAYMLGDLGTADILPAQV